MIPDDVKKDPRYLKLYETTRMVAKSNLQSERPTMPPFSEADFTAAIVGMRLNAVGGLMVTLETSGAEKDKAFALSDAATAGELVHIHATRKV